MLKRKIDAFLNNWFSDKNHNPLIVYGARQIGKTTSILEFAKKNYKSVVEINFYQDKDYKAIFNDGFSVDKIIYNISLINPNQQFIPNNTLIFFDEVQDAIDAVTSLKFFKLDGRFDVICSGSMLGINYNRITSISVGFKEDYKMNSLDFEEFLWANGYDDNLIENLYLHMKDLSPLSELEFSRLSYLFKQYIMTGGMPRAIETFIEEKNLYNIIKIQNQLYIDYENDIKKYVNGLDVAKVINFYRHITPMLSRENHKFQITKLSHGAKSRDYAGCDEWLKDAGIINVVYNISSLSLPLKGNEIENDKRIYYCDNSFLISSLDEDAKADIRLHNNFEIYNGALMESIICESLIKQGYENVYFYKSQDSSIEIDFCVRSKNLIIPIEVKSSRGKTKSLNRLLNDKIFEVGIKFTNQNIGFSNNIYTFPHFLSFLIKRFLEEKTKWD